ncbi:MAG: cyclase family protein [Calditrichaeota bacterium]|nr:cyclase family protein [Calditrichota bacterium]MCB9068951.1 cyclase family protein [Calditrichia bacterium]
MKSYFTVIFSAKFTEDFPNDQVEIPMKLQFEQIFDISVRLGEESITFPGDPAFEREVLMNIPESGICELSGLRMSAHSGTHIDMPSHFIEKGKRLGDYAPAEFIFSATVVEIDSPEAIFAADVHAASPEPGTALLFKTANSLTGSCCNGKYTKDYVYLSADAANACVEKKVALVGIDYITIEDPDDPDFPAHHAVLGNGIFILEGVNLRDVPAGKYTLIALPLNIPDGEASPVRAILLR